MSIVFDRDLETGNDMIDTQHKELIDRVNRLSDSIEQNKEKRTAIQTLDFLMDYTVFHFQAEEKLQEDAGYPELAAHKDEHAKFTKAVEELKEVLEEEEGPTHAFVAGVNKNISDWLVNHIQICDKKVAAFVNQK